MIKGIITGLLVSVPLGPIGILIIQRTLNKGRMSGFVSGLGATVADTLFALIAGLGLSIIINFIRDKQIFFQIAGGLFVIYIGLRIFYTNPAKALRLQRMNKTMLSQDFVSVFLLTVSNPMAIFLFLAIMAAINIAGDKMNFYQLSVMMAGVFAGAAVWWFILSTIANKFRKRIRLRSIWWMNKITGTVVFIFGIAVLASVWIL